MERTNGAGLLPASTAVLRRQVELLGVARRWSLIALGGLMLLVFGGEAYAILLRGVTELNPLALLGRPGEGEGAFDLIAVVAVFWALGVWHAETPGRRLYHWSLPVERGAHDRWRVVAGALWMMAGIAAFLLGTVLMTLVAGYGERIGMLPWTLWLNYFTGAVTLYLLAMIPALRSEHPLGWVFGVLLGMGILPVLIDGIFGLDGRLVEAWGRFLTGPLGPATAIGAGIGGYDGLPDPGTWVPAMLLWLAIAASAVYATTLRVPDA